MEKTIEVKTINGAQGVYATDEQLINVDVNDRGTRVEDKIKARINADTLIFLDGVSIGYGAVGYTMAPVVEEVTVTETDMVNNPDLADVGVKVGDVIGIEPEPETPVEEVIAQQEEEIIQAEEEAMEADQVDAATKEVVAAPKKKKA